MALPGAAEDAHFTRSGREQALEDLDGRGFARAVRSEQAKAFAFANLEIKPAQGFHLAVVGFAQAAALDRKAHAFDSNELAALWVTGIALDGCTPSPFLCKCTFYESCWRATAGLGQPMHIFVPPPCRKRKRMGPPGKPASRFRNFAFAVLWAVLIGRMQERDSSTSRPGRKSGRHHFRKERDPGTLRSE